MTDNPAHEEFDVIVVGGGPAGLSAALYCTRLGNQTALINRGGGRAAMMQDVHNVIGITEETTGNELLSTGIEQLREYGCTVYKDVISSCSTETPVSTSAPESKSESAPAETRSESDSEDETDTDTDNDTDTTNLNTPGDTTAPSQITLSGTETTYIADYVVLATGFTDVRPDPPLPRTGRGLHYCLHCDAYMFIDEPVYVMGTSESAAHVATIMLNFTDTVDLLTRGDPPTWSDDTDTVLKNHPIDIIHEDVSGVQNDADGWLTALEFEDGTIREYTGGFAMYGADYNNGLANELGCELNDDGTVAVDDHGQTSVENVYAVGDLTPGHNQVPIALADGAKAGISIHWQRRPFPRDLDLLDELGPVRAEEVPGLPDELLERAIEFHTYD
ncbi:NAD(P)/FAD-dependent oxidoreductase [Natrialba sp. PRR66]|uniref:NAD(P)/FAD-dependent oxidoreductase n=1 Tax=Natrialba sp. PRR66 TaxID=3098146 RepID=UPI002B1D195F|nr:NAD(P)/FAD-dependent oxidoreductase [Natrialba sp. PRR66]